MAIDVAEIGSDTQTCIVCGEDLDWLRCEDDDAPVICDTCTYFWYGSSKEALTTK